MEHFLEQLKNLRKHVLLRAERKAEIRGNLTAFMRGHQAAVARPARAWTRVWRPVFAALSLFALLGAGTTYASEDTLPGNPLYGIKLWREEVQARFMSDAEARAEWEAERAERRLEEAARLAAADNLSPEVQAELEARFASHAERVGDRIRMLGEKENFQAVEGLASRFEASLNAHNRILARLEERESKPVRSLGAFKQKVAERLVSVNAARLNAEEMADANAAAIAASSTPSTNATTSTSTAVTSTEPVIAATSTTSTSDSPARIAAENQIMIALNVMAEATRYLEEQAEEISSEELTEAEERIEDARAKVEGGAYREAFRSANEAIRAAQEAKILLRAESQLKLKLNLDRKEERQEEKREDKEERGQGRNNRQD